MGNYVIATSSTCDIEREWLDAHHVPVISYSFEIDGQIYKDDCREATRRRFYSTMREGKLPNTSQINSYAYYEFFKDLIEDGIWEQLWQISLGDRTGIDTVPEPPAVGEDD